MKRYRLIVDKCYLCEVTRLIRCYDVGNRVSISGDIISTSTDNVISVVAFISKMLHRKVNLIRV
jgi:hypothetical protein